MDSDADACDSTLNCQASKPTLQLQDMSVIIDHDDNFYEDLRQQILSKTVVTSILG